MSNEKKKLKSKNMKPYELPPAVDALFKDFIKDAGELIGGAFAMNGYAKKLYPTASKAWEDQYEAFKAKWKIPNMP